MVECEEFLNLESQQVEQWICSDEIVVNSEEDVFKIILKWVEQNESRERKEKFHELFRHLHVDNIWRHYLKRNVRTHKLVLQNFSCNMLVQEAMKRKNRHSQRHYF